MMVCWLTLQILAASPVVKTVFMRSSSLAGPAPAARVWSDERLSTRRREPESSMTSLSPTPCWCTSALDYYTAPTVVGNTTPHPCARDPRCKAEEEGLTDLTTYSDYNQAANRVNANPKLVIAVTC